MLVHGFLDYFLTKTIIMSKDKSYTFIYLIETDGEIAIRYLTAPEIIIIIEEHGLTRDAYAIVDGPVVKSFNSQYDLNKL